MSETPESKPVDAMAVVRELTEMYGQQGLEIAMLRARLNHSSDEDR